MADKLTIFRGALRLLGDAHGLSSLTEPGPAREALESAWRPSVDFLLEQGLWNFAVRSVEITADEDVEALYGYTHAFTKPDDWLRTVNMGNGSWGYPGFEDYEDEGGYWFASATPLYVRYISNDTNYGWDVGAWRQSFAKTVETYLAFECGLPITAERGNRNDLFGLYEKRLKKAKILDAVDERVMVRPSGRLTRARGGYSWRDDGRR